MRTRISSLSVPQSEVCNYCRGKRCHFARVEWREERRVAALSSFLLSSLAVVVFRMQNIQTQTDHIYLSLSRSPRALAESPYLWATKLGGKRKKVSVSSRLCHRVRLLSCAESQSFHQIIPI